MPLDLANIIWPEIATARQPKINLPISDDPIADGLVAFVNPAIQFSAGLKRPCSYSGNATRSLDKNGSYWKGGTVNSPVDIGATGGLGSLVDLSKPWSIACRIFNQNATSGNSEMVFADHSSGGASQGIQLFKWSTGHFAVQIFNVGNANVYALSTFTLSANTVYNIMVVSTGGTAPVVSLYIDAVFHGNSAALSGSQVDGASFRLLSSGAYQGAPYGYPGKIYYFAVFQGDKSFYAKRLAENPWQLLSVPITNLLPVALPPPVDLSGAAQAAGTASGSISSQLALAGASVSASTATGLLTSVMELSGVSAAGSVANGNLLISLAMSGAAIAAAAGVGQLLMEQSLAGASQAQASATGAIEGGSDLSGSATSQTLGSGDLASAMPLAGDAVSNSVSSGAITVDSGMSGAAVAGAAATGALTLSMTLSGASVASALAAAGLTAVQPLDGSAQGGAIASGDLSSLSAGDLAGNSQSAAAAAGQLFIAVPMNGAATAYASGAGNLAAIMPIAGASAAVVNAAGDLTVELNINLAGNALSQVLAGGDIRISMPMSGAALAEAIAQAALSTDADNVAVYDPRYEVGSDDNRQLNYFVTALLRYYEVSA